MKQINLFLYMILERLPLVLVVLLLMGLLVLESSHPGFTKIKVMT